jgi:hypothetical protein
MKELVKVLLAGVACPLITLGLTYGVIKLHIWGAIGGTITAALVAIPMWGVKAIVIGLLIGLAVWGFTLTREYAFKGAEDKAAWRDVRVWAAVVLALEVVPYLFF